KHPVNGDCFVPLVDLDKCCPTADRRGQAAPKRPKRRKTLRQEMLEAIVGREYPQGVPANIATSAVQQKVAAAWKAECQARGLKPTEPPSWDTKNRKLRRSRH